MSRSIKFGVWPEEVIEHVPSPPMRLPLKIDWRGEPETKAIKRLRAQVDRAFEFGLIAARRAQTSKVVTIPAEPTPAPPDAI